MIDLWIIYVIYGYDIPNLIENGENGVLSAPFAGAKMAKEMDHSKRWEAQGLHPSCARCGWVPVIDSYSRSYR